MNPFCKRPPTNPHMAEDRSKLPDNLFVDLAHSQISYLESIISNNLMILGLPKEEESPDSAIGKLTKMIPQGNSC